MSYEEFMRELEVLLAGVPVEEKEEALQYYADYFADAGKENEEQVLRELESPQKTAALIKAGLKGGGIDSGEFTEYGYTDERFEKKDHLMRREPKKEKQSQNRYSYQGQEKTAYTEGTYENSRESAYGGNYSYGTGNNMQGNTSDQQKRGPWTNKWLKILLVVLLGICACPMVFSMGIAAVAVIFGLACAGIAIFFGLAVGAVGVVIAGIVMICAGISKLIVVPSVALLTAGIGLLIVVIGMIATAASVKLCMLVYPALFRFLVGLCRKPFHRKAGV